MRWPGLLLVMMLFSPASAQDEGRPCLSLKDMRDVIAAGATIPPAAAIKAARLAAPDADILRVRLCRHEEAMYYIVVALHKNGRFVRVTLEAVSGAIVAIR